LKVQGPDLARIQDIGAQIQQILSGMPDTNSIFAERVSQGFYLNVEVNRPEAARYGLTVADVQRVITSEIGGQISLRMWRAGSGFRSRFAMSVTSEIIQKSWVVRWSALRRVHKSQSIRWRARISPEDRR